MRQSLLSLKGLTLSETPSTPTHLSLSQFNLKFTSVFINDQKISISNNNLIVSDRKEGKLDFLLPFNMNGVKKLK